MTKYSDEEYIAFNPYEGDDGKVSCQTIIIRRARKTHACFIGAINATAGHAINPGDRYRDETCLVDNDHWVRFRCCLSCIDNWLSYTSANTNAT